MIKNLRTTDVCDYFIGISFNWIAR